MHVLMTSQPENRPFVKPLDRFILITSRHLISHLFILNIGDENYIRGFYRDPVIVVEIYAQTLR
jgi:hypothetical protein